MPSRCAALLAEFSCGGMEKAQSWRPLRACGAAEGGVLPDNVVGHSYAKNRRALMNTYICDVDIIDIRIAGEDCTLGLILGNTLSVEVSSYFYQHARRV